MADTEGSHACRTQAAICGFCMFWECQTWWPQPCVSKRGESDIRKARGWRQGRLSQSVEMAPPGEAAAFLELACCASPRFVHRLKRPTGQLSAPSSRFAVVEVPIVQLGAFVGWATRIRASVCATRHAPSRRPVFMSRVGAGM